MNKEYSKLSKNALICMYIASGILVLILAVAVIVVWRLFFAEEMWAMIVAIVVLVLCVFELLVSPCIRYNRYKYHIDDECIDVIEGLVFVQRNIVPIERLHKIAVIRGPIDRMLGLGKVQVTTAGGDVTIRFLEMEKAEKIAEFLKHRINQIASEEKEML